MIYIDALGTKRWHKNLKLHREDGPAVEYFNGNKEWFLNGKRHREDGPAYICVDGHKEWWIDGVQHSEEEHLKLTASKVKLDALKNDIVESHKKPKM